MSKPKYHLRLRTWKAERFVSLWLIRTDGGVESGLLWGELIPQAAEAVIAALGLPVDRGESAFETRPLTPEGCVPVAQQGTLFEE